MVDRRPVSPDSKAILGVGYYRTPVVVVGGLAAIRRKTLERLNDKAPAGKGEG